MLFSAVSCCTQFNPTVHKQVGDARTFSNPQKIALVTDVFLAALVITAGLLIILAANGVDLGPLNAFSQFTEFTGKVLILGGLLMIAYETLVSMILMCKHICKLQDLKKETDLIQANQNSTLDTYGKQLSSKDQEIERLRTELKDVEFKVQNSLPISQHTQIVQRAVADNLNGAISKLQHEQDISARDVQIKNLQDSVDQLTTELELAEQGATAESENAQKEQEELTQKLQQANVAIQQLKDKLTQLEQDHQNMVPKQSLIDAQNALKNLQTEIDQLKLEKQAQADQLGKMVDPQKLDDAQNALKNLQTEIDQLKLEKQAQVDQLGKMVDPQKLDDAQSAIKNLQTEIDQLKLENQTQSDKMKTMIPEDQHKLALAANQQDFSNRITLIEKEKLEAEAKVQTKEAIDVLKQKLAELEKTKADTEEEIKKGTKAIEDLKEKFTHGKEAFDQIKTEYKTLETSLANIKTAIDTAEATKKRLEKENEELEQKLNTEKKTT